MGARLAGAEPIIVVDVDAAKLERARRARRHARSSSPAAMTSSRPSSVRYPRAWIGRSRRSVARRRCSRPSRACGPAARRWRSASGAWARRSSFRSTSSCSSRSGWWAASTDPPTRRSTSRGCGGCTRPAACRWTSCSASEYPLDVGQRGLRRRSARRRRGPRGPAAVTRPVRHVSEPARPGRLRQRRRDRASAPSSSPSSRPRGCSVGFVDLQDDAGQALAATVAELRPPAAALPALRRPRRRRAAGGDHRDGASGSAPSRCWSTTRPTISGTRSRR